jgi:hypothetical protein
MLCMVVEGEPGIFPQPIAGVLRRVGRWAERAVTRKPREEREAPPPPPTDVPTEDP